MYNFHLTACNCSIWYFCRESKQFLSFNRDTLCLGPDIKFEECKTLIESNQHWDKSPSGQLIWSGSNECLTLIVEGDEVRRHCWWLCSDCFVLIGHSPLKAAAGFDEFLRLYCHCDNKCMTFFFPVASAVISHEVLYGQRQVAGMGLVIISRRSGVSLA